MSIIAYKRGIKSYYSLISFLEDIKLSKGRKAEHFIDSRQSFRTSS